MSENNKDNFLDYEGLTLYDEQIKDYINDKSDENSKTFIGTHAEWNALTAEQKVLYEIVNFTDDSATPDVVDPLPTQNSTHLVSSGGVWDKLNTVNNNFGTVELSSVAMHPYAVGDLFINAAGQMVKCTAAIAIGDSIIIGSNVSVTSITSSLLDIRTVLMNYEYHWIRYTRIGNIGLAQCSSIPIGTFSAFQQLYSYDIPDGYKPKPGYNFEISTIPTHAEDTIVRYSINSTQGKIQCKTADKGLSHSGDNVYCWVVLPYVIQ